MTYALDDEVFFAARGAGAIFFLGEALQNERVVSDEGDTTEDNTDRAEGIN